jgi:hypothetical protein
MPRRSTRGSGAGTGGAATRAAGAEAEIGTETETATKLRRDEPDGMDDNEGREERETENGTERTPMAGRAKVATSSALKTKTRTQMAKAHAQVLYP